MFAQERERYSRNALLAQVGWEGQARWGPGRVLVVGAGGIGSAALLYLAAAGVGRLGLVDVDHVELSNLQRQIIHRTANLGRRKVTSAAGSLAALNPHCRVETLKLLLGRESDLTRRLLAYDGLQGRFQAVDRVKRPDCELCGKVRSKQ
jgi:adenylyltransferase/sulfurtransferase